MDTQNIKTRELARLIGGAKRSLGQHFLTSGEVVEEMVAVADISKEDTIFEIGPGLGILTAQLLKSPAREILACEKDRRFCDYLRDTFKSKRLKVVCQDALTLIPSLRLSPPLKVVANLPYNISSPAIISLLTFCPTLPEKMVLMLQKEVAERICAKAGGSNRGFLTVLVELMGEARLIREVEKNLFYPVPEVDSAVVLIDNISPLPFEPKEAMRILKTAFSQKRKKLKNSLFATLKVPASQAQKISKAAQISQEQRPEELSREQWLKLIGAFLEEL